MHESPPEQLCYPFFSQPLFCLSFSLTVAESSPHTHHLPSSPCSCQSVRVAGQTHPVSILRGSHRVVGGSSRPVDEAELVMKSWQWSEVGQRLLAWPGWHWGPVVDLKYKDIFDNNVSLVWDLGIFYLRIGGWTIGINKMKLQPAQCASWICLEPFQRCLNKCEMWAIKMLNCACKSISLK